MSERGRIGLFGGSFDPPHDGHVEPAKAALQALDLERVYFLPTADPPHKRGRQLAPPLARFAMVELALLAEPRLLVSGLELTPDREAFTVDTVGHFRRRFPEADLHLLIGADSFAAFHSWVRWREIAAAARLVVLARPGWDADRIEREAATEVLALVGEGRAVLMDGPKIDRSATDLRRRLAAGEELPTGAVSASVLDYIRKYHLYR